MALRVTYGLVTTQGTCSYEKNTPEFSVNKEKSESFDHRCLNVRLNHTAENTLALNLRTYIVILHLMTPNCVTLDRQVVSIW